MTNDDQAANTKVIRWYWPNSVTVGGFSMTNSALAGFVKRRAELVIEAHTHDRSPLRLLGV